MAGPGTSERNPLYCENERPVVFADLWDAARMMQRRTLHIFRGVPCRAASASSFITWSPCESFSLHLSISQRLWLPELTTLFHSFNSFPRRLPMPEILFPSHLPGEHV